MGLSDEGIDTLRHMGAAPASKTSLRIRKEQSNCHSVLVNDWINEAIEKKELIILVIDDYTNIHTKQRPKSETVTEVTSMATVIMKKFPGTAAIPIVPSRPVNNPKWY